MIVPGNTPLVVTWEDLSFCKMAHAVVHLLHITSLSHLGPRPAGLHRLQLLPDKFIRWGYEATLEWTKSASQFLSDKNMFCQATVIFDLIHLIEFSLIIASNEHLKDYFWSFTCTHHSWMTPHTWNLNVTWEETNCSLQSYTQTQAHNPLSGLRRRSGADEGWIANVLLSHCTFHHTTRQTAEQTSGPTGRYTDALRKTWI